MELHGRAHPALTIRIRISFLENSLQGAGRANEVSGLLDQPGQRRWGCWRPSWPHRANSLVKVRPMAPAASSGGWLQGTPDERGWLLLQPVTLLTKRGGNGTSSLRSSIEVP